MREYYSITELTREFDVSTRTLRFYEDEGLVQPVRRGRTRLFRPSDRHLIRQIMRGKRLGFSINEIREIIQMYKEPPGEVGQLKLMIKRIEEKREDLRQKRRDLEETLAELDQAEEVLRGAAGGARRQYLRGLDSIARLSGMANVRDWAKSSELRHPRAKQERSSACNPASEATCAGSNPAPHPFRIVAVFLAEFRGQHLFLALDRDLLREEGGDERKRQEPGYT